MMFMGGTDDVDDNANIVESEYFETESKFALASCLHAVLWSD